MPDAVRTEEKLNPKLSEYRPWRDTLKKTFKQKSDQKSAAALLIKEARNSRTDHITGLLNSRGYEEKLRSEFERAMRNGQILGLISIDLDGFKSVNDTFGHDKGDEVLRAVAYAINDHQQGKESATRTIDIPARIGGDEFMIICPDIKDGLSLVAGRIRIAIEKIRASVPGIESMPISASIGAAYYVPTEEEKKVVHSFDYVEEKMIQLEKGADIALYKSKEGGRNKLTIYDKGMIMPQGPQNNG